MPYMDLSVKGMDGSGQTPDERKKAKRRERTVKPRAPRGQAGQHAPQPYVHLGRVPPELLRPLQVRSRTTQLAHQLAFLTLHLPASDRPAVESDAHCA